MDEGKIFQQQNSLDYFIENSTKIGYKSMDILIEAAKYIFKKYNEEMKMKLIEKLMKVFKVNIIVVLV